MVNIDKEILKEFALDYIRCLKRMQKHIDPLYGDLLYGKMYFDGFMVDLDNIFDDEYETMNLHKKINSSAEYDYGPLIEELKDRGEEQFYDKNDKPVAYIHIPETIWDLLYWGYRARDKSGKYLATAFRRFMNKHNMTFGLTGYGRNAILVYYIGEE